MHGTVPHDVVNVYFVAHQRFVSRIGINHADKAVALLAEEIEKGTVLAEFIGVGRIVDRTIIVAEKQNQAVADKLAQLTAASHIGLFTKEHKLSKITAVGAFGLALCMLCP